MQFNFNCEQILGTDFKGLICIDAAYIHTIRPIYKNIINEIIDNLGKASAKSRKGGSNYVSTTSYKFFKSGAERMYIKAKEDMVLGFLRVGYKKHSFRDKQNNYYLKTALFVMDFYVHSNVQRKGYGKEIFDKMLVNEKLYPHQLVYESINDAMIFFLEKNYKLKQFIIQNDGLVIYDGFFYNNDSVTFDKKYSKEKEQKESEGNKAYNNMKLSLENPCVKPYASPQLNDKKYFAHYYLNDLLASNNQLLGQINNKRISEIERANTRTPRSISNLDLPYLEETYIKEKLEAANNGINQIKDRLRLLESNISPDKKRFPEYKKRNEYTTILDLKSVKPKETINFNQNNDNIYKINTPTTYGIYGSYYNINNNFNNK